MIIYEVWFSNDCSSKFFTTKAVAMRAAENYIKEIAPDEETSFAWLDELHQYGECTDVVAINEITVIEDF